MRFRRPPRVNERAAPSTRSLTRGSAADYGVSDDDPCPTRRARAHRNRASRLAGSRGRDDAPRLRHVRLHRLHPLGGRARPRRSRARTSGPSSPSSSARSARTRAAARTASTRQRRFCRRAPACTRSRATRPTSASRPSGGTASFSTRRGAIRAPGSAPTSTTSSAGCASIDVQRGEPPLVILPDARADHVAARTSRHSSR